MKTNQKGFTLIELLAVIIILAIIALIAVPTIMGIIDSSREEAAINAAYGYVDAVEKSALVDMLAGPDDYSLLAGVYTVQKNGTLKCTGAGEVTDITKCETTGDDTTIITPTFKGTAPAENGTITVSNNQVIGINLTINQKVVTGNPSSSTKLKISTGSDTDTGTGGTP